MSQSIYTFQAEVAGQTWYAEAHGATEEQAKEEAIRIFRQASGRPLNEIENIRLYVPEGDENDA